MSDLAGDEDMCWWTQQAVDLAIEFGLPWYGEPSMTIEMLTTHIAGELDLGPEDYEEWKEIVSWWYLYFRYGFERPIESQKNSQANYPKTSWDILSAI